MKYFVVTTKNLIGSTKVIYPDNYQTLLDVSVSEGSFYFSDDTDGGKYKRVHVVPDSQYSVASDFASHKDVIEITEQDAFDLSDKYYAGTMIDDEAQIRLIEIKTSLGQELSADEQKAIDPDDSTVKGFGKKDTLRDKITKIKSMINET